MITSNVIHRVFRIRWKNQEGTAFAIDIDGRQYLITANHIVASVAGSDAIELFGNGVWTAFQVRLIGHAPTGVDISVLAGDKPIVPPKLPLEATSCGVVYGQDVHFLGFPYGIIGNYIFGGGGYPLPLVKRATVSHFQKAVYLLDGHNNPGFSGGPVIFVPPGGKDCKVMAVISGFQAIEEPVFAGGQRTPLVYRYNTGIIVSHAIDTAVELIQANPVGCPLAP